VVTKKYDAIIAGGGTGRDIAVAAERFGLKVALVEKGPLGGTCHNRGCMPSKMLIQSADVLETARGSGKFGIASRVDGIEFPAIVRNVFQFLDDETAEREEALRGSEYVDFYKAEGSFTGPKTLQIGDTEITADKVFIVGGTRPVVPNIPGADNVPYLTSDEALRLQKQPEHLVIVGGGYIAVELAHFFGALGTKITMLVRGDRLLDREDAEISAWFTREFASRYNVRFQTETEHLLTRNGGIDVRLKGSGETISCDQLLFAAGRRSNSDIWDLAATGVEIDGRGFVGINEYMETNVDGVWAVGDITGVLPLKHVAVRQARLVVENVFGGERKPMDYRAIPHAVFTSPQVAGVGKAEEELTREGTPYKVGRYEFKNTGMGIAIRENGLVKVLADPETDAILGCHIVGPHASILIQQAVIAMNTTGKLSAIVDSVHAHPTLPQVMEEAFKAALYSPDSAVLASGPTASAAGKKSASAATA